MHLIPLPDYLRNSAISKDDDARKWLKSHITAEVAEGAENSKCHSRPVPQHDFSLCPLRLKRLLFSHVSASWLNIVGNQLPLSHVRHTRCLCVISGRSFTCSGGLISEIAATEFLGGLRTQRSCPCSVPIPVDGRGAKNQIMQHPVKPGINR